MTVKTLYKPSLDDVRQTIEDYLQSLSDDLYKLNKQVKLNSKHLMSRLSNKNTTITMLDTRRA